MCAILRGKGEERFEIKFWRSHNIIRSRSPRRSAKTRSKAPVRTLDDQEPAYNIFLGRLLLRWLLVERLGEARITEGAVEKLFTRFKPVRGREGLFYFSCFGEEVKMCQIFRVERVGSGMGGRSENVQEASGGKTNYFFVSFGGGRKKRRIESSPILPTNTPHRVECV